MKPLKHTEDQIRQIKPDIAPPASMDSRILMDSYAAMPHQADAGSSHHDLRRILMNRMTKLSAVAASLLIVAVLMLTAPSPVYAIEQTIKALDEMRSIHAQIYFPGLEDPAQVWVQFHENGMPEKIRLSNPAFDPDGPKEAVWENNLGKIWSSNTNTFYIIHHEEANQIIGSFFNELDPKQLVQKLENMQQAGTAQIEIEQPDDISKPIKITATLSEPDLYLGRQAIAYIDQATKLVLSLETLKGDGTLTHKNGHFGPTDFNRIEFFDYNQPFSEKIFTLNVSEDAIVIDRASSLVGLSVENRTIEETAIEVAKQFMQSLIDKDYKKAGLMYGGLPAEKIQEAFDKNQEGEILRVISIGPTEIHPNPDYKNKAFVVPCVLEIRQNEQIKTKTYNSIIREVDGQPGRWAICGGI
jgi:hypothetical protein